jgi:hypothetical protein
MADGLVLLLRPSNSARGEMSAADAGSRQADGVHGSDLIWTWKCRFQKGNGKRILGFDKRVIQFWIPSWRCHGRAPQKDSLKSILHWRASSDPTCCCSTAIMMGGQNKVVSYIFSLNRWSANGLVECLISELAEHARSKASYLSHRSGGVCGLILRSWSLAGGIMCGLILRSWSLAGWIMFGLILRSWSRNYSEVDLLLEELSLV